MTHSFRMALPSEVGFVLDRLESAGYSAYCVGGCVRDALMGKTPSDYDVTTSAKPDEMLRVFSDCRVVETGLKHGTLTVVLGSENIEITTYRIDGEYGDCRHPADVTFTDRLSDDLCRRDFTVNAMAYSPSRGLVDLYGGQADLCAGIIRCVGRAEDRFSEDGLRILRALRFSSVLDFTPDKECADAVRKLTPLLEKISRERIYTELTKLLGGKNCAKILALFPETIAFSLGVPAENVSRAAKKIANDTAQADPPMYGQFMYEQLMYEQLMRYAVICDGLAPKNAVRVIDSLKPSREEKRTILNYLEYRDTAVKCKYDVLRLISERGDAFPAALARYRRLLGLSDCEEESSVIRLTEQIIKNNECRSLSALQVNGDDLAALGLSGRSIGVTLNALLDSVMRGDAENEKNALLSLAKTLM